MDLASTLDTILAVVAIVLALAALYAVWVLVTVLKRTLVALEEVRFRLVPLLEKADVTVDAVNAELLRVDTILSQAEEVGDAVTTASDFIRSPINSAAQGLAKFARAFKRSH